MSVEKPMMTFTSVKQAFRKIKAHYAQQGVVDCAPESPAFQSLIERIGHDPMFILQEIATRAIHEVNREDARFDFSTQQLSFMDYAEKWILLPETKTVQVQSASLDHVRYQAQRLLDKHLRHIKSFSAHYDGLLMPIIRTMEQRDLRTAGEAILTLRDEVAPLSSRKAA